MSAERETGLALRAAKPTDLPQLEIWANASVRGDGPPYISVSLTTFDRAPARGRILIVSDNDVEIGAVVVSWLWSNALRGEIGVIDDYLFSEPCDFDLVRHEVERWVRERDGVKCLSLRDTGFLGSNKAP